MLVELFVDRAEHEGDGGLHVGQVLLHVLDALGRAEQADRGDVAGTEPDEVVDRHDEGVARREHRVDDVALPPGQVVGQAVRVGADLEGLLVAHHAEEADLGRRQEPDHPLEHPQARAQDRHDERLGARQLDAARRGHRGVDVERLDPHVARRLVGQQGHQFFGQPTEGR